MTEYNEGDLIEAIKGERVIRDRVHVGSLPFFSTAAVYLGEPRLIGPSLIEAYVGEGYTITVIETAKPKFELPAEKFAAYTDKYGTDVWVTDGNGHLACITSRSSSPEKYAPFTRLEPRAVTAAAVIEAIRNHPEAFFPDILAHVGKQFEVTTNV